MDCLYFQALKMYSFGVQYLSFPLMRVKFGVELDAVGNPAGRQKMNGDVRAYEPN